MDKQCFSNSCWLYLSVPDYSPSSSEDWNCQPASWRINHLRIQNCGIRVHWNSPHSDNSDFVSIMPAFFLAFNKYCLLVSPIIHRCLCVLSFEFYRYGWWEWDNLGLAFQLRLAGPNENNCISCLICPALGCSCNQAAPRSISIREVGCAFLTA